MNRSEIRKEIINLYKEGKTLPYICKALGVTKATVSYQINKEGISRYKPPVEITEELLEKMQIRYDECKDLKIVSKEFNVSINRLKNLKRRVPKYLKEALKDRRFRVKSLLVEYKGGKCQICNYNKCLSALEFHHINPMNKDFNIAANSKYRNLTKLKKEVDKCILVCANCHREIHAKLIDLKEGNSNF